jgi:hypothetical protein
MTERFGGSIRQIISEHFGGLVGDQLLVRAMLKYRIEGFDDLSDETKKQFIRNFIEDCYDHMVSQERKKELEDEYVGRIFGGYLPKKEEKKEQNEEAKKVDIIFRRHEEDRFQVVDNLSADDMNKVKVIRSDDVNRANLLAVMKKAKLKEEEFELEKVNESIDNKMVTEYDDKTKEQSSWGIWRMMPAILIFASLSMMVLRDASDSKLIFYLAIALFIIGALWFLKDTVKRRV